MGTLTEIYRSSVGKKLVVAITGVCLLIYLIVHLIGNLLLYKSDHGEAFNTYAEILPNILIIRIVEIVLFLIFFGHILTGTIFWFQNRGARPQKYAVNKQQDNSSLTSRTMFVTGSIVFIFLVIHMKSFWFPSRFYLEENPSMYLLVKNAFANPVYSGFYVVAMFLLGFHLRHGFQSALQTFGIQNQRYASLIDAIGVFFWFFIPLLFATMPIYFLFNS